MESVQPLETRRVEVSAWVVDEVLKELESRVRLHAVRVHHPWWKIWAEPIFLVTGPTDALDALQAEIQRLDDEVWWERQW